MISSLLMCYCKPIKISYGIFLFRKNPTCRDNNVRDLISQCLQYIKQISSNCKILAVCIGLWRTQRVKNKSTYLWNLIKIGNSLLTIVFMIKLACNLAYAGRFWVTKFNKNSLFAWVNRICHDNSPFLAWGYIYQTQIIKVTAEHLWGCVPIENNISPEACDPKLVDLSLHGCDGLDYG